MKMSFRDDFIAVFDGAMPSEMCEKYIRFFKNAERAGLAVNRQRSENASPFQKEDLSVTANGVYFSKALLEKHPELAEIYIQSNDFNEILMNECLKEYCRKYPGLAGFPNAEKNLSIQDSKLQKTIPGQGYHVWHHEHGTSGRAPRRLLAFSVNLNTVDEGGETEFLYQKVRFKPVMGQLLLWPSYFTHAHRGNPPLSSEKYLLTGWIEK